MSVTQNTLPRAQLTHAQTHTHTLVDIHTQGGLKAPAQPIVKTTRAVGIGFAQRAGALSWSPKAPGERRGHRWLEPWSPKCAEGDTESQNVRVSLSLLGSGASVRATVGLGAEVAERREEPGWAACVRVGRCEWDVNVGE